MHDSSELGSTSPRGRNPDIFSLSNQNATNESKKNRQSLLLLIPMFIFKEAHFFLKREGVTESLTNLNLGTSGTQALNNVSTKRSHTGI